MSGIYIHIPFCKKACHYCNFHFSTLDNYKDEMVAALKKEIGLRKDETQAPIETIYFGGGTPSTLSATQINLLIVEVFAQFNVVASPCPKSLIWN
jgi:oxygen-independent coproporphyrinogen-3 oxidase